VNFDISGYKWGKYNFDRGNYVMCDTDPSKVDIFGPTLLGKRFP